MKKIVFIFILTLLCCSREKKDFINGYFFNKNNLEIYSFNKDTLIVYNLLDSSSTALPLKINGKYCKIEDVNYCYNFFIKDSITLNGLVNNEKKLDLEKFQFSDFNEIITSNWKYINNENGNTNFNGFIRVNKDKNIFNFFKYKEDFLAIKSQTDFYQGKMFDKFHFYSGNTPFILVNLNLKELFILHLSEKNRFEKSYFLNLKNDSLNSFLIGEWIQVGHSSKNNNLTFYNKKKLININEKKHKYKIDSIKSLLDYTKIKFTSDNFFKRNIQSDSIKFDYRPETNYIFMDNPDFENQYFEIRKLSQDTLSIKISEPNLTYTYVKIR